MNDLLFALQSTDSTWLMDLIFCDIQAYTTIFKIAGNSVKFPKWKEIQIRDNIISFRENI